MLFTFFFPILGDLDLLPPCSQLFFFLHFNCRARCTGASLTWCLQFMTQHNPLSLLTTLMASIQIKRTPLRTTASTCIPQSTLRTVPGLHQSNVILQNSVFGEYIYIFKAFLQVLNVFFFIISHLITYTVTIVSLSAPPRPATPEKFTMPHRCARFGPGGHLIQVLPNLPSAGQPALVEIHNMEVHLL